MHLFRASKAAATLREESEGVRNKEQRERRDDGDTEQDER